MTKVTSINARNGQTIVDGAMEKLMAYAAELGLGVKQEGRWQYYRDGSALQLKLQFVVGGEQGVEDKIRTTFELYARSYGLEPRDFGAVITSRGKQYKLIGFNTKARKFPYLMEEVATGEKIRFSEMAKERIIAARGK
jgi:hypothetical protein